MKLQITTDDKGIRHTYLDGMEIKHLRTLSLYNAPRMPSEVRLDIIATELDIDVTANVSLNIDDNKYQIKSISNTP